MTKYRTRVWDRMNNIWLLEKRWLFFFWVCEGAGPQEKVQKEADQLNKEK